eukprot:6851097-Pyramimonas_sp.AAC.1
MVCSWAMHKRYIIVCCVRRGNQLKFPACTHARYLRVNEARGAGGSGNATKATFAEGAKK